LIVNTIVFGEKEKNMPWSNLDPETSSFETANMLIPYKGAISLQYLNKIAENTGYNYQQHLLWGDNTIVVEGTLFDKGGAEVWRYDATRDYQNVTVLLDLRTNGAVVSAPPTLAQGYFFTDNDGFNNILTMSYRWIVTLTTTWNTLMYRLSDTPATTFTFDVRANSSGTGIEFRLDGVYGNDRYLWGTITRLNNIDSGVEVS
jgi:hypothetical protein